MSGSIVRRHLNKNFELSGVFASAAAFLAFLNKQSAEEGMLYFDTTLDQLRTFDGTSWSAAGINSTSAGSLDDAANIGTKITVDGTMTTGVEIEATDTFISSGGALLLLDNDDIGSDVHSLEITQVSTAPAIQLTNATATTDDIQGTGDAWAVTGQGVLTITELILGDDEPITIGGSSDAVLQWDQTRLALTAAADSTFRIGAAAFSYDVEFIGNTAVTNLMKWDLDGGVDSVGALVFDNVDLDLGDDDVLRFGDAADITMTWDKTQLVFSGQSADNAIHIGDATNLDLIIFGDTTTDAITFDTSEEDVRFNGFDLTMLDDDIINFGDANDVSVTWDQTNLLIEAFSDNTGQVRVGSSNAIDWAHYGSTATKIALFDVSGALFDLEGWSIRVRDDDRVRFGDSADGSSADADIYWDQTQLQISSYGSLIKFNDDVVIGTDSSDEENLTVNGNLTVTGTFSLAGSFNPTSLLLTDNETLAFGDDSDITMTWDETKFVISALAADKAIHIGDATNIDVVINGDNTNDTVTFDTSAELCTFNGFDLYMLDDDVVAFGDAQDITMTWDKTKLVISGAAENAIHIGDAQNLDIEIFGDNTNDSILFDTDAEDVQFNGFDLTMLDDDKINFGNSDDIIVQWDQSELAIDGAASNTGISFGKNTTVDVEFTGGSANVQWDANRDTFAFADDAVLGFGGTKDSAADFTIAWDQSELAMDAAAANGTVSIGKTTDTDVTFHGGSAGLDVEWNSSSNMLHVLDNAVLGFGGAADAAADFTMSHDSTNTVLVFSGAAANTAIHIGDATNLDLVIFGDTTTDAVTFDTSEELCTFNGFDLQLADDDKLIFGDSTNADVVIQWDQTELQFDAGTANGTIAFGKSTATDVQFNGASAGVDMEWNASSNMLHFIDEAVLGFGAAADGTPDITITWDSTNNDLLIDGATADTEIKIGQTNNQDVIIYGDNTNQSVAFDTSAELVTFTDFDLTMSGTTDAVITCALQTDDFGGLAIPNHATSNPVGTPATGSIFYEIDASKLWVHKGGGTWEGVVLS